MEERVVGPGSGGEDEERLQTALRPRNLDEFIGQDLQRKRLSIALLAARQRREPLDHLLLSGPPGLGKTTLAHIVAGEMGGRLITTSGPALERAADLMGMLTRLDAGDVFFIDEIHRMPRVIEEYVYPAMEDFRIDIVLGDGVNARTISMQLKHFTLIGATTRGGMLSGPMRDRFKMREHLDYYTPDELATIVTVNAKKLGCGITAGAARELAARSRGTPRVANARLYWARVFAAA